MATASASSIRQFDCDPLIEALGPKWKAWVNRLEQYFKSIKLTDDTQQVNSLFFYAGEGVSTLHESLKDEVVPNSETTDYAKAKYRLNTYFDPKRNKIAERNTFLKAKQEENESIHQFASRLRLLSQHCEFENAADEWIVSVVVLNCRSEKLRREYLAKADLKYAELVTMGRNHDNVEQQARQIEGKHEIKQESLYQMTSNKYTRSDQKNNNQTRNRNNQTSYRNSSENSSSKCFKCGRKWPHDKENPCPALGKKCYKCNGENHFKSMCRAETESSQGNKQNSVKFKDKESVKQISERSNYTREELLEQLDKFTGKDYCFNTGDTISSQRYPEITLIIADTPIKIKIDTMSSVNVIDEPTFAKFNPKPKLKPRDKEVYPYQNPKPIQFLGEFLASVKVGNKHIRALFAVAKGSHGSLLGFPSARLLGVDPVQQILHGDSVCAIDDGKEVLNQWKSKYPSVFSEKIGELKGVEVRLHINDSVRPVQAKPRNVPYYLRDAMDKDLQFKIDNGIIEQVENEPTTWLNELVPRPKPNGDVRVCIDMRMANRAITCEKYEMPNVDDILFKINGMKYFAKLDLNKAFEQVKLHKDSRYISRFRNARGIFQYCRLFFGLNSAPETFNNLIRKILEGIPNQVNATDDILMMGHTLDELHTAIDQVLSRLAEHGLTVNENKCEFDKTEITFFGMRINAKGVSLKEEKVRALLDAELPETREELISFLGLTVYASKWINRLAIISEPLRELSTKQGKLDWKSEHLTCFDQIKAAVVASIGHFNMEWDTHIYTDAGPKGLAAWLVQENPSDQKDKNLIRCASRRCTPSECNLSQIEREGLGYVWALEKYDPYIIGNHVTVHVDCRAVELIFNNPLSKPPARFLSWALRTSHYNVTIVHQPGLGNIADFLSRHPSKALREDFKDPAEDFINMIVRYTMPLAVSKDEVLEKTLTDPCLSELSSMIKKGHFDQDTNAKVRKFGKIFNELTVSNKGYIVRDQRLVIPESMYIDVIKLAHEGHQGLRKTKELLRSKVWFPDMDSLAQTYYDQCSCQFENSKTSITPITMSPRPKKPWEKVSLDFFGPFDNVMLMVAMDDYSNFPLVEIVTSSYNAKVVTDRLESQFAIFGVPAEIRTDNGPPFQSKEFADFAKRMGFVHRKVTPLWPRANGVVESFMKNLGKVLRTAVIDGVPWKQRLREFLRVYRATPHSTTKVAPGDLFLRNANTSLLPSIRKFVPTAIDKLAKANSEKRKVVMKQDADKRLHTKEHTFKVGDLVIVKQPKIRKSTPKFNLSPYTVTSVHGNMIQAKNEIHDICRNSSFFAHYTRPDPEFYKTKRFERHDKSYRSFKTKVDDNGLLKESEVIVEQFQVINENQEVNEELSENENEESNLEESFNSANSTGNQIGTEGVEVESDQNEIESAGTDQIEIEPRQLVTEPVIPDPTGIRRSSRVTKNQPPERLNYSPTSNSKAKKREKQRKKSSEIKHLNGESVN